MNFKIWIGVDDHGRPLVGAAACNDARDRGALHDCDQLYPSQLRYRIAVFYPESGTGYTGVAPLVDGEKKRRRTSGRWQIRTRTEAREDRDNCFRSVRGLDNPDHEFPKADHARTTRRKVSP